MSHAKIAPLLPWYVNGTLDAGQRQAVESELAHCAECRADVAEFERVSAALQDIDARAPGPSEFVFSRTMARIDDLAAQAADTTPAAVRWWRGLNDWGQAGAVASVAAAAALLTFLATHGSQIVEATRQAGQPQYVQFERTQPAAEGTVAGALNKTMSAPAPPAAAPAAMDAAAVQRVAAKVRQQKQIVRTGEIHLLVGDVEKAIAEIGRVARRYDGSIAALDDRTPQGAGERHAASMTVSIPAPRFDAAMEALAAVGGVQSRTVKAEDVTDQIVDGQARLRNLRRTESDMLKIMDRSGKIGDVLEVENQLSSVREQIEQLDAQLKSTQARVAYSTIAVQMEDERPVGGVEPGPGAQLRESWRAAVESVKNFTLGLVARVMVVVAFAPYWLGLAALGAFVWYRLRR